MRKKKKNKNTRKAFHKLKCSPENNGSEYTCYSDEDLMKMRAMWNARYPDQPITSTQPKIIWNQLKSFYAQTCNKESCWVRQMVKNNAKLENELLDAFAPESPAEWKKNPNEWLSSVDIVKVMSQYEKKYKCFDFIGPSPIDYDAKMLHGKCVWDELCHFQLSSHLNRGHKKIGIIFNLDPHTKGGSHWVSMFVNVKNSTIFYFDSAGAKIPAQILKLVLTIMNQGKQLAKPIHFHFDQNYPVEHQYGNTECGMYSLYFIIHMLEDKINANYLKTHILKDKYIEKFRRIFFNQHGAL
jgi:hypothetical protein